MGLKQSGTVALILAGGLLTLTALGNRSVSRAAGGEFGEFEGASLVVVFSVSDQDAQILAQGGSEEPLARVKIKGPNSSVCPRDPALVRLKSVFQDADGLGQVDFFYESPEPTLEDLMEAFPPGEYLFMGKTVMGNGLLTAVELSYELPPAPDILFPQPGDQNVPTTGFVAQWFTQLNELQGIRFEIEAEEDEAALKVDLPADATSFAVPDGWLQPNREYVMDIKVIAENGNQTVRDVRFVTQN